MFDGLHRNLRELVRSENYVVTHHARRKLWGANLMSFDLETLVLFGHITARQRDEESGDWKYIIEGTTRAGYQAATVVKLSRTGKLVFITVYRLE